MKKVKIPESVKELRYTKKEFAKKNGIHLRKGGSKKERKFSRKKFESVWMEHATTGLDKSVRILAENPNREGKKIDKVKSGIERVITDGSSMELVTKQYKKNRDSYPNMILLPFMIMNTLAYYSRDSITEEEKAIAQNLDSEKLVKFCEKILKKQIGRLTDAGLSDEVAFQIAVTIPTTKFLKGNREWYRRLIAAMYDIAATEEVDVNEILRAVRKVDKGKSHISKKDFLDEFYLEFIMQKNTNRSAKLTDHQKELQETLINQSLAYLDSNKPKRTKAILKEYIRRRKRAEEFKTDSKRVIKFVDHANSNSPYSTIKTVVQELIADNSSNELYLQ